MNSTYKDAENRVYLIRVVIGEGDITIFLELLQKIYIYILEIVFTRAAPAFDNLFMGCVFNINTVHKTVEKLTFQAFY